MARNRLVCTSCDAKIPIKSFCPKCGTPTPHASAQERIVWEMGQWETSRPAAAPPSTAPVAPPARTAAAAFAARAAIRPQAPAARPAHGEETRVRPPAPHTAQRIIVNPRGAGGNNPAAPRPNVVALAAALREASRDSEEAETTTIAPTHGPERNGNRHAVATATAPAIVEPARFPRPIQTHSLVNEEPEARSRDDRMTSTAATAPSFAKPVSKPLSVVPPVEIAEKAPKAKRARKAEKDPKPARAPKEKLSRKERRLRGQTSALDMREGETLTRSLDGRSRLRRATLLLTNYRVAVVSRSRRRRIVRWIPLEEVSQIDTAWRGAPTVMIEASIESLSFNNRSGAMLAETVEALEKEVREAHGSGARRHHPEITQEWCDRTGEVWDSNAGRLRLWIRRHPVFTLTWLASIVPIAYFAAPR